MSSTMKKNNLDNKADGGKFTLPSGWDYLTDGGVIQCVFSSATKVKMGMGASSSVHEGEIFWYVEQVDGEVFEARRINTKHVPVGNAKTITLQKLVNEFSPQLAYFEDIVLPAMNALEDILDQGDEFREEGRLYSAEVEYERVCIIEEKNVRALFGLGLIFLSRNEVHRTRELLSELVQVKAAFDGKNQFLFNEFGIALRKSHLFAEAVIYYRRALDFVMDDENLYYNLGRAHYEEGDWNGCLEALIMSHRLNPGLEQSRDLFKVIVGLAENERLLIRYDKPPVPAKVVNRVRQILAVETGTLSLDESPVVFGLERGRARAGRSNAKDLTGGRTDDFGNE